MIITCAVTGAGDAAGRHPELPIRPDQIATAAIEAARAGAAVVHIHVRDPESGAAGRDPAHYRAVVERIRESDTDVVINLTAGMGGDFFPDPKVPGAGGPGTDLVGPEARLVHVEELRPEICSLDCGSLNFGDGAYLSTAPFLRDMADRIKGWGVKPELECFEMGHVRFARQLCDEGRIAAPAFFQLALGAPWGAPADPRTLLALVDMLPEGAEWAGFGISRMQLPMVAQAVLLGGHVRVGLEDNLYLEPGVFASNAQLVERAVQIIQLLGARNLGPEETRQRLELKRAG